MGQKRERYFAVCWDKSGERWPGCSFPDERSARELAAALCDSVADGIAVITETGRVIERWAPSWEDPEEPYPLWSLPKSFSDEFWMQHPEIVSSCAATERYFTSSGTRASALAKHWRSSEAIWTSILEQSEYGGAREESTESSLSPTLPPLPSESSLTGLDEEDSYSLDAMDSPSGPPTLELGSDEWPDEWESNAYTLTAPATAILSIS